MDCVILGGTHQVDDTNLLPSPKDKDMIINGCNKMVPGLKVIYVPPRSLDNIWR